MKAVAALTIMLAVPLAGLGQSNVESEQRSLLGEGCIATPVRDAPFSAEAVTAWYPLATTGKTELRSTARYFRDGQGRVRVEYAGGNTPQRVFISQDAGSGRVYLLDTTKRTAMKTSRMFLAMIVGGGCRLDHFVLPLSTNRFVSFIGEPKDEDPLGERSVSGLRVIGTRFSTDMPSGVTGPRGLSYGERWLSPELGLMLRMRREDAEVGVVEHDVARISRAEPSPHLFEVPDDYKDAPLACMSWTSAHAYVQRGFEDCENRRR